MIFSKSELIEAVSGEQEVFFYGAGNVAKGALDFLNKNYTLKNIKAIAVTGHPKENSLFGIPVFSFEDAIKIIGVPERIVVATKSNLHNEIASTINYYGQLSIEYIDDEFGEELIRIRRVAPRATKEDLKRIEDALIRMTPQTRLNYFVLNILDHCNLNCTGCDHFAPLAKPRCVDFNTIKRDIERFSEIMGKETDIIGIMGGEPLLHPDITSITEVVRKAFPYTKIQIDTNGLLLMNQTEGFWKACRDNNITIVNTKYPINLDHDAIERKCFEEDVSFEYYGNTGYVQKTLFKIPFDIEGKQDARRAFSNCFHANHCVTLMEGRLFPCTIAPNAHIFNNHFGTKLELSEGDWLDIYSDLTKKNVLDFISKPIPFCRYCDVKHRSFGYPWSISKKIITEWTLTEREKHPKEEKRIRTPREEIKFEVHLAEHCNLNCRGCFHFSCLADEEFLSIEEYKSDCSRLSELYHGRASKILLLGGEPLLHPEINEFMHTTRKFFPNAEIVIVTNGTLLGSMGDDFWLCCRKNRVIIEPTKYPINVDYEAAEEKAKKEGVDLRYFNNGSIEKTLTFQPLDLKGGQNKEDNFYGCYRANLCITLKHGRLYTCIIPAHIHHFSDYYGEDLPDFLSDGIDIYKASSSEEISEFLTKPIEACRYCDRTNIIDGQKWGTTKKDKKEWVL